MCILAEVFTLSAIGAIIILAQATTVVLLKGEILSWYNEAKCGITRNNELLHRKT